MAFDVIVVGVGDTNALDDELQSLQALTGMVILHVGVGSGDVSSSSLLSSTSLLEQSPMISETNPCHAPSQGLSSARPSPSEGTRSSAGALLAVTRS